MNPLISQLLQLGPGIAAGAKGNGQGMSAFMESFRRTSEMLERQEQERNQISARQQDRERLITRQDEADKLAREDRARQQAMQTAQLPGVLAQGAAGAETVPDAEQSIDALYRILAPQMGGMEQLGGVRDVAMQQAGRTITARQKRQVGEFVEAALKTSFVADNPDADPEIQNLPAHVAGVLGKPSARLSELQQFAQLPVGKPAKPQRAPSNPTEASLAYEAAGGDAAKAFGMLNPPRPTGDSAAEPLMAIMGENGEPVYVPRSQAVGKRPASTREQGRAVTSGDASDIAEFNTALDDVATLRDTLKGIKATGTSAAIGAAVPNAVTEATGWGTEAKQKNAVIARVKQVIGKALEGGVLRKEDESKYAKILPTISDTPEVVATKLNGLEKAIQQRQQNKLDALADAGYDISRFAKRAPAVTPPPPAGPPIGERRKKDGQLLEWDGKGWFVVRP